MRTPVMAMTALGLTSSMRLTVSRMVSGVSPGPPRMREWQKSMPASLHARDVIHGKRLSQRPKHGRGARVGAKIHSNAPGLLHEREDAGVRDLGLDIAG